MLKGTKEFANFGNFVQDSGGLAMRLPPPQKDNQLHDENADLNGNGSDWVPSGAYKMAHDFR